MFHLLRNPNYLKLWLAQVIAELGDGITRLVIVYLVSRLSHDPLILSFVIIAQVTPNMLFGALIGPFIDRYSKQRMMISADLYRFFIVLLMIPAQGSLAILLGLVFLQGIGTVFFEPARTALVPRIVGEERIPTAISFSQSTMIVMGIVGPSIAGLLISFRNFSALFMLNAATYILSAVLIFMIRHVASTTAGATGQASLSYKKSLQEGFRTVYQHQGLFALLLLLVPVMLVMGVINTNLNAVFLHTFKVSAEHFGFLETVQGIGAIAGASLAPILLRRILPNRLLISAVMGVGICCVFTVPLEWLVDGFGLPPVYVWSTVIGIVTACANVPLSSLFVQLTPNEVRGRGAAIFSSIGNMATVSGLLLGGGLASIIGVIYATALAGGLLVLVCVLFPLLKYYQAIKIADKPQQHGGEAVASS